MNSVFYLGKKTLHFLLSLFSKSTLLNPETFYILLRVNEGEWSISIHNLYSHERIMLTVCKSVLIQNTASSTVGWIQSENFKRQCLTQNVQSVFTRLLADSKPCWPCYARGLQGSARKYNPASSKHLYIKCTQRI